MRNEAPGVGVPAGIRSADMQRIESMLIGLGVCAYLFAYPPLIFTWYIPDWLRLGVEFLVVFPMLVQQLITRRKSKIILVFLLLGIIKAASFAGDAGTVLARFNKIVFAVCLLETMRNDELLVGFIHRMLEFFILATTIQLILSAIFWYSFNGWFTYNALHVHEHSEYGYFGNILLGNLAPRHLGPIKVARPMGYFMEPGLAASLVVVYSFAPSPLALDRQLRRWRDVVLAAGALATASITALGLLGARIVFRAVKKRAVALGIIFCGVALTLLAYEALSPFVPSAANRAGRTRSVVTSIKAATPYALLLGRKIGAGESEFGAINSGIGRVLVEHGLLVSLFLLVFLWRASGRIEIFTIMLLMNFAFDFFWWPFFWVIAAVLRGTAEGNAS
jgi:hypothetical protein